MPHKVICDVDTGGDDAVAILAAGHSSLTELVAVTVVAGNAPLEVTLENSLKVVEHGALAHVPVYAGAEQPLISEQSVPPLDPTQARRLQLAPPTIRPQSMRAAQFLVEYYMSEAGPETVLVPTAPLTNIALALRLEPRIVRRIPRLVTMGGAYIEGNTTPSAEFNILADPEAAHIVYSIELTGTHTRGRTVADISGYHKKPANVDVGVGIDRERFMHLLEEALAG